MQSTLFSQLNEEQVSRVIHCLHGRERSFLSGEFLLLAGQSPPRLGILLEGRADVVRENLLGEAQLVDRLCSGALFGETFAALSLPEVPVSVVAKASCRVLFLEMERLLDHRAVCPAKQQVVANLLQIIADKNERLRKKMSYLTHKTIRGRLLAYLLDQVEQNGSLEFTIPYNRSELAEYLCTDRSAMSRELSHMKQDGLITYQGKHFQYLEVK